MGNRLEGKVAIVTGATRGIGKGVASAFVGEGAKVLFTGRDRERGEALEAELGKNTRFLPVDVANESEIAAMVSAAVNQFGGLDCLVSNAGEGFPSGAVTDLVTDKFWQSFHVLVGSIAYGMKYAAPEIGRRGGGSIVNISSIAASGAGFGGYAYSGAKAAMLQLSKWAAMNLAPQKVRVNTISPGPVLTAIFGRSATGDATAAEARLEKLVAVFEEITPLHLAGKPEDIAHAAVFLASEESRYVTGQDLVVDGGILNSRPVEEVGAIWERIRIAVS
jgi:NAD(P)-dependent dehydrogenase (short-subunit alcohol dehydrogenase family)